MHAVLVLKNGIASQIVTHSDSPQIERRAIYDFTRGPVIVDFGYKIVNATTTLLQFRPSIHSQHGCNGECLVSSGLKFLQALLGQTGLAVADSASGFT